VKNAAAGSLVILERGAARFSVPPRETRPAFVVQAGDVRVEVVGTRFLVERVGGSARVQGYEGKVRVIARGQNTLVQRGESWPPSAAITLPTAAPGSPASAASQGAPLAPSEATQPAAAEPAASARTSGHHRKSRGRSAAADLGERFERAALLEASAPDEALRVYRSLAAQGGRWGANALYAMARLETERGRRASAERLSRAYLTRYPNGPNASDARALIERSSREP
jgi:TolA-binding protein